jgi:hypothetical protein
MAQDNESFFSRWSRRKVQDRVGQPLPPEPVAPPLAEPPPKPVAAAPVAPAPVPSAEPAPAPAPTLDDVAQLTPQADFSPFVAKTVPSEVRNAAVKKLFADPHFNVMDGLDIYIDDYTQPSPLSKVELAKMVGAQFLKLVDEPQERPVATEGNPDTATEAAADPAPASDPVAADTGLPPQATEPPQPLPHDDHADLQLQPDHAPERESPGGRAG